MVKSPASAVTAVVVDHVLDHDQLRRDVVVGHRAGLGLPDGDRAGAVSGVARRIARGTRLRHRVVAGVDRHVRAGRLGAREVGRVRARVVHGHREVAGNRGAVAVVDHVLDHDQLRRDVVVGHRAGLGLPDGDRAGAVARLGLRVAGRAGLRDRVAARVDGDVRARRLGAREVGGLVPGSSTVIVKLPAVAVPPLSLITCLITTSFGAMSLLVTVQVLVSPDGDRAGAVGRVSRRVARRARLGDVVAARVDRHVGARRLGSREVRRVGAGVVHGHREVRPLRRAAAVVDHVLDHDQLRRDVVVGDRAGLGLADGDRAVAVSGDGRRRNPTVRRSR